MPRRSHLFLLRHAHSSWASPGQRDHQRPLDERGRKDASRLCEAIRRSGIAFDAIVCSSATRATETLDGIRPALASDLPVEVSDDLYALGAEAYLAAAHRHGDRRALLLIGHNPMVEAVARALAPDGEADASAAIAEGFPTCALARIGFDGSLQGIRPGDGFLEQVIVPRGRH
ncbi:histidine phosphatase family protein [Jiella sp. M17.18]|uniref:SixA phosphatase family protein n=1 Tax=Jiella sp. M17.18 TaxID=3234247 RepID=UPI0034DF9DA3